MRDEHLNLVLAVTLTIGLVIIPLLQWPMNEKVITCDEIANGPLLAIVDHPYIQHKCN